MISKQIASEINLCRQFYFASRIAQFSIKTQNEPRHLIKDKMKALLYLLAYLVISSKAIDYYPGGYFDSEDVSKVVWSHGVNSKQSLKESLESPSIQMLEADIIMGTLDNGKDKMPIMAHPPDTNSDLSLSNFVEEVIKHNKDLPLNDRKGMKLDFKDMDAAKVGIPDIPKDHEFPLWINADILQGPVNASSSKMDGRLLIQLQRQHLPNGTLSLGWTTRFGKMDDGEIINNGSYTREQINQMVQLINDAHNDMQKQETTVEITFPLRAGIALNSVDDIKYLLDESDIKSYSLSVTLWEGAADPPIEKKQLEEFTTAIGKGRVFVDLPYSFGSSGGSRLEFGSFLLGLILVTFTLLY